MKQLTNEDLKKLPHKFQVALAIFCAKQVIHLVKDSDKEVCTKAIETAEAFLEGKVTKEDCRQAANAAYTAAYTAAHAAAYAAANAAAANAAAYTAANAAAYTAANAAAYTAANAAAYTAANAAAYTANAAYAAANAAAHAANAVENKEQIIKEQWALYNELLNFDAIFEEEVL